MKKGLTELVFILDKSGSMEGMEADSVGGFNSMIESQKAIEGDVLVTTVLFSTRSMLLHDRVDIKSIVPMNRDSYRVGGGTALLDAIGETVEHIAQIHKYAREEDVPERTIFAITTDGMENASRRFMYDTVRALIKEREEQYGWEFLFLAANIDTDATADIIGVRREMAASYSVSSEGIAEMYKTMSDSVASMRKRPPSRRKDRGNIK